MIDQSTESNFRANYIEWTLLMIGLDVSFTLFYVYIIMYGTLAMLGKNRRRPCILTVRLRRARTQHTHMPTIIPNNFWWGNTKRVLIKTRHLVVTGGFTHTHTQTHIDKYTIVLEGNRIVNLVHQSTCLFAAC